MNSTPSFGRKRRDRDAIRPIRLDEDHDAVARVEIAEQREPDRGHAGARRDRVVAVLELRREQLELARRRIRVARVVEAEAPSPLAVSDDSIVGYVNFTVR